ncbi:MAG: signal recognition particle-docking protein FtsY [Burkholderiaceae bacterium]|nr:signal recognition particle-docking protein FtsY [Burkholderiaceae bacterium]
MFSFFKKKPAPEPPVQSPAAASVAPEKVDDTAPNDAEPAALSETRSDWLSRLRGGLRKTGQQIGHVFTAGRIDEALYEELESALLMSDAGVKATTHLLKQVRERVKRERTNDAAAVKSLLIDEFTTLLLPLQRAMDVSQASPTVIMMTGVNGAGKTTSIGKLTRHLGEAGASVLLAAGDTFRAAAREQLDVWAGRNHVDTVSQEGGDPAAVSFDAVKAGIARKKDVVLIDTAGRLPTQTHLMDELKKIKRVIEKAATGAPHEILLVIDGNTGQNALAQVKAFDDALGLTGLIVTKLDGTAKGGVLAAIAMERPIPVYFIGVGESVHDLRDFNAAEFSEAIVH